MIDELKNHKSIRKFKSDPIPKEDMQEMLLSATKASTTGNMQVYSIIVTTEASLKEKLYASHFKQAMVKEAPVIATFCADFNRFNKWCSQRNAHPGYDNFLSFYTASIDALLAAQNFCVAAETLGYGICYLGTTTYMAASIIDVLKLPKHVVPVTSVVVGKADENPGLSDRLPLEGIVHHETYQDYETGDINSIYEEKEGLEFYKNLVLLNKKDTLSQIFTDIRYKKEDNITFSKSFLETIEKQGFFNHGE